MSDRFFIDAETDGLYGRFLTTAALIVDETGREKDHLYVGIPFTAENLEDEWTRNHIPQVACQYQCMHSEEELLNCIWKFWLKYRGTCVCIADVNFPVECRLFEKCVEKDIAEREFLAPFPLMDLSSMLFAKGIDPLTARRQLTGEAFKKGHNALEDVRIASEIFDRFINNGR